MEIDNDVLNAGRTLQSVMLSIYRSALIYPSDVAKAASTIEQVCHGASRAAGRWNDLRTGEELIDSPHIVGEKLMLIVSDAAGMGRRMKGRSDDNLPHRLMTEVELADTVIRIADLTGALGVDIGQIMGDISVLDETFLDELRATIYSLSHPGPLMRVVGYVAKAMEGHRKARKDAFFIHRPAVGAELARAVFMCFDVADRYGYDLASAIAEKLAFNAIHPDHKKDARLAEGGKAY
ncbi:MAG: hypothetical protein ACK5OQ_16430 [Burkholderiales bacterium]|jgi:hypothetical protein